MILVEKYDLSGKLHVEGHSKVIHVTAWDPAWSSKHVIMICGYTVLVLTSHWDWAIAQMAVSSS